MNEEKVLEAMDNLMVACGASSIQSLYKSLPPEFVNKLTSIVTSTLSKHLQAFQAEVQQIVAQETSRLNK